MLTLIQGILTAVLLVGILYVILGIIMLSAASRARSYVRSNDLNQLASYHAKLRQFFSILGVLAIIGLVILFLVVIGLVVIFLAFGGLEILKQGIPLYQG